MFAPFRHRLEYLGIRTLMAAFRLLPRPTACRLGAALGWLAGTVVRLRRSVVDANLGIAFAAAYSRKERDRIARRTYVHFGAVAADLLRLWDKPVEEWMRLVESVAGMEIIEKSLEEAPSAALLSGHFGCWEFLPMVFAARGMKMCSMAKPIHNSLVEAMIRKARAHPGLQIVTTDESVSRMLRLMKDGWLLGFVADQDARKAGVFVDFFGRPASTATGPALFALRFGLPMIVGFTTRTAQGKYRFEVDGRLPQPEGMSQDKAVAELTRLYIQRLEARVRSLPEQYWWFHRRWKTRPPEEGRQHPISNTEHPMTK